MKRIIITAAIAILMSSAAVFTTLAIVNNEVETVELAEPTNLSFDKHILSWSKVEGADKYVILFGNTKVEVSETRYDASQIEAGTKIKIYAVGSGTYSNSGYSEVIVKPVVVTKLSAPVGLSFDGHILTWEAVNNATKYIITIGDETKEVTTTSYDARAVATGTGIKVRAIGGGNYTDSVDSAEIQKPVVYTKLSTPTNISLVDGILTWGAVENATKYIVSYDGDTKEVAATSFDATNVAANSIIRVCAVGTGLYVNSDYSNGVSKTPIYIQLSTPTGLSFNKHTLSWNPVENAVKYVIQIGNEKRELTTTTFDASEIAAGTTFKITAIGSGYYLDSLSSAGVEKPVVYSQLSAPINLVIQDDKILTWDPVVNADKYIVVFGDDSEEVSENSFDVSVLPVGTPIKIYAKGHDLYLDSGYSIEMENPYDATAIRMSAIKEIIIEKLLAADFGEEYKAIYTDDQLNDEFGMGQIDALVSIYTHTALEVEEVGTSFETTLDQLTVLLSNISDLMSSSNMDYESLATNFLTLFIAPEAETQTNIKAVVQVVDLYLEKVASYDSEGLYYIPTPDANNTLAECAEKQKIYTVYIEPIRNEIKSLSNVKVQSAAKTADFIDSTISAGVAFMEDIESIEDIMAVITGITDDYSVVQNDVKLLMTAKDELIASIYATKPSVDDFKNLTNIGYDIAMLFTKDPSNFDLIKDIQDSVTSNLYSTVSLLIDLAFTFDEQYISDLLDIAGAIEEEFNNLIETFQEPVLKLIDPEKVFATHDPDTDTDVPPYEVTTASIPARLAYYRICILEAKEALEEAQTALAQAILEENQAAIDENNEIISLAQAEITSYQEKWDNFFYEFVLEIVKLYEEEPSEEFLTKVKGWCNDLQDNMVIGFTNTADLQDFIDDTFEDNALETSAIIAIETFIKFFDDEQLFYELGYGDAIKAYDYFISFKSRVQSSIYPYDDRGNYSLTPNSDINDYVSILLSYYDFDAFFKDEYFDENHPRISPEELAEATRKEKENEILAANPGKTSFTDQEKALINVAVSNKLLEAYDYEAFIDTDAYLYHFKSHVIGEGEDQKTVYYDFDDVVMAFYQKYDMNASTGLSTVCMSVLDSLLAYLIDPEAKFDDIEEYFGVEDYIDVCTFDVLVQGLATLRSKKLDDILTIEEGEIAEGENIIDYIEDNFTFTRDPEQFKYFKGFDEVKTTISSLRLLEVLYNGLYALGEEVYGAYESVYDATEEMFTTRYDEKFDSYFAETDVENTKFETYFQGFELTSERVNNILYGLSNTVTMYEKVYGNYIYKIYRVTSPIVDFYFDLYDGSIELVNGIKDIFEEDEVRQSFIDAFIEDVVYEEREEGEEFQTPEVLTTFKTSVVDFIMDSVLFAYVTLNNFAVDNETIEDYMEEADDIIDDLGLNAYSDYVMMLYEPMAILNELIPALEDVESDAISATLNSFVDPAFYTVEKVEELYDAVWEYRNTVLYVQENVQ